MRIFLVIAALAVTLPASEQAPAAAGETEAKAGDRVVCKQRMRTGTRFKNKICKTVDQWEEIAEQGQSGVKEMTDRPHIRICGPNGCD